jgi:hypothetical protein
MDFNTLFDAFEFASMGPSGFVEAYLNLESGDCYIVSDYADDNDLPDDLGSKKYLLLPDKNDLGLGKPLVLQFARDYLEQDLETVEGFFRHRGAYARFKALLDNRSLLDTWHAYERRAQADAVRQWAEAEGIAIND